MTIRRSIVTGPSIFTLEFIMSRPVFVFDAYGTLFDVHACIAKHAEAAGPDGFRLSELWRAKQLEYTWTLTLAGRYVDFWELTERALDFALARFSSVDKALRPNLLEAYFALEAYPDARTTLAALKARGDRAAILSNGSPKMLASAVAAAGLDNSLDAVLSVASIRLYKPRPEVYALATRNFSCSPAHIFFFSSNRWDAMGAAAFGFRSFWVNRTNMPAEYDDIAPVTPIPDLIKVLELAA
jgi:2-haloacid dehalogenase